ncbi:hypothetical protein Misp04_51670 [Micromonospora sp. NBRC 101691]|nr:hypothetical protein Misp04_51670 [Micromonospora sp. NBRC 101691]
MLDQAVDGRLQQPGAGGAAPFLLRHPARLRGAVRSCGVARRLGHSVSVPPEKQTVKTDFFW